MAWAASPRMTRRPLVQRDSGVPLTRGHLMVDSIIPMIFKSLGDIRCGILIRMGRLTHRESHPWNSRFMSLKAVV
jgi:hypothetical protein